MYGTYLNNLKLDHIYKHNIRKTITESDNNLFCLLTMNHHPVHLDNEYAKSAKHGRILVVGTYVVSLVVGMTVSDISGKAIANLDYEKINHTGPVYIGDTLHAETKILDIRESRSNSDNGIVYVETRAYNQDNQLVLRLRRHILIPKEKE